MFVNVVQERSWCDVRCCSFIYKAAYFWWREW